MRPAGSGGRLLIRVRETVRPHKVVSGPAPAVTSHDVMAAEALPGARQRDQGAVAARVDTSDAGLTLAAPATAPDAPG